MAFTRDWSTSGARILDHSKFKDLPGAARSIMVDLEDRLADILYGFTTTETFLGIKQGRFITIGTGDLDIPTGTGTAAAINVQGKTCSGKVELCTMDADGNEIQITSGGEICVLDNGNWRSGDMLLSSNTGAPSGWTEVSSTYSNKFIRISTGTPLSTGGSDTHTTPSHTLTVAEMPAHSGHAGQPTVSLGGAQYFAAGGVWFTDSSTGGGGGHTHDAADNVPAYVTLKMYKKD